MCIYRPPTYRFEPVTEAELKKIILAGNSKSCQPLTSMVNLSLSSNTVLLVFKAATLTPLLKKAGLDADDLKNYRPVSSLPYVSKLKR